MMNFYMLPNFLPQYAASLLEGDIIMGDSTHHRKQTLALVTAETSRHHDGSHLTSVKNTSCDFHNLAQKNLDY